MTSIQIIEITQNEWTKIEGFSSKGLRVKSWYERIVDNEVFLYKEPKIYNYVDHSFVTKEIWTELIAYKVGVYIGLNIPEAIPAVLDNNYGILIRNFLERGEAGMPINELIEAKEILSKVQSAHPHNIDAIALLLNTQGLASNAWLEYIRMLIFDCLIGNNDRHDENWGFLYDRNKRVFALAPIYDNASCLTSGENEERVQELLRQPEKLDKYINNSKPPNLYKTYSDDKHYKHYEIMQILIDKEPSTKELIKEFLNQDYLEYTRNVVDEIQQLVVPDIYKLTNNRKELILKILEIRKNKLKDLLNVYN